MRLDSPRQFVKYFGGLTQQSATVTHCWSAFRQAVNVVQSIDDRADRARARSVRAASQSNDSTVSP